MKDESPEIIVKLKRLRHQVEGAIVLIESGCVRPDPHYRAIQSNDTPNTFHVGDFTITDRFIEPQ